MSGYTEASAANEGSESSDTSDQVRLAHLWVDFRVIQLRKDVVTFGFSKEHLITKILVPQFEKSNSENGIA